MNYALIGCGRIAKNHISSAISNGLNIVALCDIDEQQIQRLTEKFDYDFSKIATYTNYKEMIEVEDIDLVAIATESGLHAEIALSCIDCGIHCIIEKPIAMSMKDAREICKRSQEKHVVVSANHQNRFNKAIIKIREAVENGSFGKLMYATAHIRWNRDENYYTQAPWRGTWENDGGCLMNQCIHNADLLRWMMGDEIDEVTAYTDNLNHDYIEAEDLGMALIKFKNGSYGIFEGTTNVYPKNLEETLYIFGKNGTVKAGGTSTNILEEWMFPDADNSEEFKDEFSEIPTNVYGFGHTRLYADVIDAIKSDREPLVNAEAGMKALELILGIYLSAYESRPVKFPLGDIASTDFKGRFR